MKCYQNYSNYEEVFESIGFFGQYALVPAVIGIWCYRFMRTFLFDSGRRLYEPDRSGFRIRFGVYLLGGEGMIQVVLSNKDRVWASRGDMVVWAKIDGKWKGQKVFSGADEAKAYADGLGVETTIIKIQ